MTETRGATQTAWQIASRLLSWTVRRKSADTSWAHKRSIYDAQYVRVDASRTTHVANFLAKLRASWAPKLRLRACGCIDATSHLGGNVGAMAAAAMTGGGAGSSVVTVQLGQCGNQIGAALFDILHGEVTPPVSQPAAKLSSLRAARGGRSASAGAGAGAGGAGAGGDAETEAWEAAVASPFFREASRGHGGAPIARAVLIDMEPKVVAARMTAAQKSGKWRCVAVVCGAGVPH